MSTVLDTIIEPDGTLRYLCEGEVIVRVQLHRRNGTKRCPVELLRQETSILATDSNLRELRDIESLLKHATSRCKGVDWHPILADVAAHLPEKTAVRWEPIVRPLSSYALELKDYLWYPAITVGTPTSIEGDPGTGKSATLLKLFCHLTTGARFPTLFPERPEHDFPPRNVVLFTSEDDPNSTLLPRMWINNGDTDRLLIMQGKRHPETKAILPMTMQDLPEIEALLDTYDPVVMAFDPLQSFFGPEVDMNKATDTRPVLDSIRDLCKAHRCTPLYVRHHGKAQRAKALHAGLGSIDITAHMRSVLSLYKDPDDPCRRILAHTKTNGREAPSMQLRLTGALYDALIDDAEGERRVTVEEVQVDWDGMSDLTSEDLNARESAHGNDPDEANTAMDAARRFLRDILQAGPVLAEEIHKQARQAGVSQRTLRRAKDKEKVHGKRQAQDGVPYAKQPWIWYVPGPNGMDI